MAKIANDINLKVANHRNRDCGTSRQQRLGTRRRKQSILRIAHPTVPGLRTRLRIFLRRLVRVVPRYLSDVDAGVPHFELRNCWMNRYERLRATLAICRLTTQIRQCIRTHYRHYHRHNVLITAIPPCCERGAHRHDHVFYSSDLLGRSRESRA